MLCFAIGIHRALGNSLAPALLGVFAIALIGAGAFKTDAVRGFPPGSPTKAPEKLSWQHHVHGACGPIAFLSIFGACIAIGIQLDGGWRLYTFLTAIVGFVLLVATGLSVSRDAPKTGLVQRALILNYVSWILLFGIAVFTR